MPVKAKGAHGSWFATVNGESLPCVHKYWLKGFLYNDPQARPGHQKFDELVAGLRDKGRAILTEDEVGPEASSFRRKPNGYIAVFAVSEVEYDTSGLRFRLTDRLDSLI